MKISNEIIEQIKNDINNNIDKNEILSKYNISISTYYRIRKTSNINKNEISLHSDNKTINLEVEENKNDIIDINNDEKICLFSTSSSSNKTEDHEISDQDSSSVYEEEKHPVKNSFRNFDIVDTNNIITYPLPQEKVVEHNDYIERKQKIAIIRNFVQVFGEIDHKLDCIIGATKTQQLEFVRKLNTITLDDLNIIIDNIKYELTIKSCTSKFLSFVNNGISIYENIAVTLGIDISGLNDELQKNEDFQTNLKILACEANIGSFIDAKKSVLFYFITGSIKQFQVNKTKKLIEQKVNNNNVVQDQLLINKYNTLVSN